MPPIAAHRASTAPMLSRPGRVSPRTASSCGRSCAAMSGGRLSESGADDLAARVLEAGELRAEAGQRGEEDREREDREQEPVREARGDVRDVVGHDLGGEALGEVELAWAAPWRPCRCRTPSSSRSVSPPRSWPTTSGPPRPPRLSSSSCPCSRSRSSSLPSAGLERSSRASTSLISIRLGNLPPDIAAQLRPAGHGPRRHAAPAS